jgi:protease I
MTDIKSAKILILATDGFEQSELMVPLEKLREAGATVEVASPDGRPIRGWNEKDWGERVDADRRIAEVDPAAYDALVLPGGQINPDVLRVDADAMRVVKAMVSSGKTVAAICHAPWLLVEAGAVRGKRVTSYKSIRTDVENAGGRWVDEAVVTDGGLITSRNPGDLPAFVSKIIEEVEEGRHEPRKVA